MSTTRSSPEARRAGRAGFTLVELLVALTIGGLVAGAVLQLVQGTGRFVRLLAAREEVQQNGRAALELIAADVRALTPAGIVEMGPNALRLRVPRAWGVLCAPLTPESATVPALFAAGVFPAGEPLWDRPHWGIAVEQAADVGAATGPGAYRFLDGVTERPVGTACDAIRPPDTPGPVPERYGFSAGGRSFVDTGTVAAGARVLLFEEVRYDAAEGGTAPGFWIRRMAGYDGAAPNMQPMAGPVAGPTGLSFRYLRRDGATPATTPADVRTIRVTVVTESRARAGRGAGSAPAESDTVSADVHLRN